MKITMISNYINHHQIPFSKALCNMPEVEYCFIQTEPMEEERVKMGWGLDPAELPFVKLLYECEEECRRLIDESDILLVGWMEREDLVKDGRTNTARVASCKEKDAKKARLFYEVLETATDGDKEISLVKVKLETGRHHQIRVQMSHMGNAIWGDAKYNTEPIQDRRYRQIALCAYRLEFAHPKTKKEMVFEIEPKGEGFGLFHR